MNIESYKNKPLNIALHELTTIEDEEKLIETGLILFGNTFVDLIVTESR